MSGHCIKRKVTYNRIKGQFLALSSFELMHAHVCLGMHAHTCIGVKARGHPRALVPLESSNLFLETGSFTSSELAASAS